MSRIHRWTVKLSDAEGRPVADARIAVDGGMPEHGHGFPTSPKAAPGPQPAPSQPAPPPGATRGEITVRADSDGDADLAVQVKAITAALAEHGSVHITWQAPASP